MDVDPEDEGREPVRPGGVAPEIVRVGLTLSLLLIVPALLLLAYLPRDSPEFAITLFTLAIGGVLLAFVGLLVWLASRG